MLVFSVCNVVLNGICRMYVRKSREKKLLEEKPGNKNFGKKVRILSSPWKKCHWK